LGLSDKGLSVFAFGNFYQLIDYRYSFFECHGECVEGGLPAVHPPDPAAAGGVEASDGEVQAFSERPARLGSDRCALTERGKRACRLSIAFVSCMKTCGCLL
jgi:hypothetical protein